MPLDPVAFFTGRGWSPAQAAGIVGNLQWESGLDPTRRGDGGLAYGLGQWHPDRQANFQRIFGRPIQGSTAGQQLQFVDWELRNTEGRAGNLLAQQTTIAGATQTVMQHYERPANSSSLSGRLGHASAAARSALGTGTTILQDICGPLCGGRSLYSIGRDVVGSVAGGALSYVSGGCY
jgi:hypothetical protein